ncbi:uncharacterized protein LOC107414431 [Ziziphus jujuba]|uniref:Uncharacterized protein LOC107414431 n=2 Tax=Ziziphus jujuba TaxID=326968 RepID=A0A6P3ZRI2_ZIZJJ|nr:uncharacterized protein LOC107414431 [Ziziphus jujuba]KAH7537952.1 hypothetical protein FEM48_Zijuj03G0147400 [Ziziphus jujuba var. spinosa]
MGKEWHWGGRSSKRGGVGGGAADRDATSSGCMSAVFQFFDFHQFQFPLHHQQPSFNPTSFPLEDPTSPKGVEAPRNSLKSDDSSLSSIIEEKENLNIPMGIQIKTYGTKPRASNDLCSDTSSSPGAKTPNLVARLMGLDLLPDNSHSPTFHATTPNPLSKSHSHSHRFRQPLHSKSRQSMEGDSNAGSRSLPETPRISSARRSDVDHHRLSLQINKENVSVVEDLDFSRLSYLRRKELRIEDESRSPGHYARQIVKQVKESVSRRAGMDITNTVRNRDQCRAELVNHLRSKKASKGFSKIADEASPGKHSTPSCSPRLRFMESKSNNKPSNTAVSSAKDQTLQAQSKSMSSFSASRVNSYSQTVKVCAKPKPQPLQEKQVVVQQVSIQKCKKTKAREGFGTRVKKQEESFVRPSTANRANIPDKNCKKTPLSNNLVNFNHVPTLLLPLKKCPSPPATKIRQKQQLEMYEAQQSNRSSQLPRTPSQKYEQEATHGLETQDTNGGDIFNGGNSSSTTSTSGGGAELSHSLHQYITKILSRTGIQCETPVSFTKWFSPSHPLDPSIFYYLEQYYSTNGFSISSTNNTQLNLQCNRRLLFQVVDEILVQILKPHLNMKPWVTTTTTSTTRSSEYNIMQGSELIEALCLRIKRFPCADCQVLEDIDELIDKDLPEMKAQNAMAFEEEGEGVVNEIEKHILDTLVHETALVMVV